MPSFIDSIKKRWNAFLSRGPDSPKEVKELGRGTSVRPDSINLWNGYEKSIVTTIYNKIAVDISEVSIEHCRVDENKRYLETLNTGLNNCLCYSANIDQTGRAFIRDLVMSLFDEGYVAVVPVDTTKDPNTTDSYDILTMRVGRIVEWFPQHVKVEVYNDRTGYKKELFKPKTQVAIIENPFYAIMNRPNSTLQRLKDILNDIDALNKYASSGKMDMIIKLPHPLKTETQKKQARLRRKDLEDQLRNSEFGIAYIDAQEDVINLGRPLENNLWQQANELQDSLYKQLGLTPEVFDGTADYMVMNNYYNRTITPVLAAITESMERVFLSKNARTRGECIKYFRDPFRLIAIDELADLADRFLRNEIMSSNELRGELGLKPVNDPRADELRNKNLNPTDGVYYPSTDNEMNLQNQMAAQQMMEGQMPPEEYGGYGGYDEGAGAGEYGEQ